MIALLFPSDSEIMRVAKQLGLIDPDATEIPQSSSLSFTPTQELLDALGLKATPEVEAILGQTFWMRLSLIEEEHWHTGETKTVLNETGAEEQIPVTKEVHHRVNIDPMEAPAGAVSFLITALGPLVIDAAEVESRRGQIRRW